MFSWKLSANAMQNTPFLARYCLFRWTCQTIWCHVNWSEALTKTNHSERASSEWKLSVSHAIHRLEPVARWLKTQVTTRNTLQIHHNTKHTYKTQDNILVNEKKTSRTSQNRTQDPHKSPKTQCKKQQSTAESHENRSDAAKFPISLGFTTRAGRRAIALTLTWILAFLNLLHRFIWLEIFDISILPSGTLATVHWKVCSAKSHLCL